MLLLLFFLAYFLGHGELHNINSLKFLSLNVLQDVKPKKILLWYSSRSLVLGDECVLHHSYLFQLGGISVLIMVQV